MNNRLNMLVTVPALVVAVVCLVRDESLFSFAKRVGGTYLFFSLLVSFLGAMWRISRQAEVARAQAAAQNLQERQSAEEKATEPAAAASAG